MKDKTDVGLKRNNHFVPRFYLKNWGANEKIWNYELLVPHENYPVWRNTPISHTASIDDLYVRFFHGEETDELENQFFLQYEEPAKEPLRKACDDERLSTDDWWNLIEFLTFQIFRTPTYYLQCHKQAQKIAVESIEKAIKELNDPGFVPPSYDEISENEHIPMRSQIIQDEQSKQAFIETNLVVGKEMWFFAIKSNMERVAPRLHQYKWSILSSANEIFWPTSDNPVVRKAIRNDGSITLNGGVGIVGTEIIFPITPTKAIYTRVGYKMKARLKLDKDASLRVKNLIVGNALRNVFSSFEDETIPQIRPRTVDLEMFQQERNEFNNWYNQYKEMEVLLLPKE